MGLAPLIPVLALLAILLIPALRRPIISKPVMRSLAPAMPKIGDTERIALEAGTVWWDGELFSGRPDWKKLFDFKSRQLSEREQLFLVGPVEELCRMIDDWDVAQQRQLPTEAWAFIKKERFFGMVIPESYGGLGFSAIAHSAVVAKIASRSIPAACIVMVPNSLGPAELLLHYGTDEQRQHYLPRLATGEDIPCFALTEPHAGSDAAASRSRGIVCKGSYKGKTVLGIRIDLNKRYITLAPVATVIGLAFDLHDPDHLLGDNPRPGITCALVPRDTAGIEIGRQHDPMGVPFPNGPITGTDVFIPVDFIIGGKAGAGQGWRMLMESLAAGRSVSLPSLAVAAVEVATRYTGAYATLREQFGLPIGRFEGIEEALARIAGSAYLMDAARVLTCGAVDAGERPAVLSAIVKAYLTDMMRARISDAMDIAGGAGICQGPRNVLARIYTAAPIAITVEGANILTRSLIVFGQGSIRCHPFVLAEMQAIASQDTVAFDRLFFGHLAFVVRNGARSVALALTGSRLSRVAASGEVAHYARHLSRFSAAFALATDAALATLGGDLKRREKISGRFADALAWMYLGSAAIKRFHDAGQPESDQSLLRWSVDLALWNIQEAFQGILQNLPNRPTAFILRCLIFPLGARFRPPHDRLGARLARAILDDGDMRRRLTSAVHIPAADRPGLGAIEATLATLVAAAAARQKLSDARRNGQLDAEPLATLIDRARAEGVLDAAEAEQCRAALRAQDSAVQVDAFTKEQFLAL